MVTLADLRDRGVGPCVASVAFTGYPLGQALQLSAYVAREVNASVAVKFNGAVPYVIDRFGVPTDAREVQRRVPLEQREAARAYWDSVKGVRNG